MWLQPENTTPMWFCRYCIHTHYYQHYLIRTQLQTFDIKRHKQTFMRDAKRSTACPEAIEGNRGMNWVCEAERKNEKRAKREGWLKHPEVNNKSFTSKNRDSCASGYQLMSRECLSFQESKRTWYDNEAVGAYGWWSVANDLSLSEKKKQHKGKSNNSVN